MMAGDSCNLPIKIVIGSGVADASAFTDMEVHVGHVRKTLYGGDITYDAEKGAFLVPLTQEETFSLRGRQKINLRCKFPGGNVIGTDLGTVVFEPSLSKEVI